jgi:hypothetical protein
LHAASFGWRLFYCVYFSGGLAERLVGAESLDQHVAEILRTESGDVSFFDIAHEAA